MTVSESTYVLVSQTTNGFLAVFTILAILFVLDGYKSLEKYGVIFGYSLTVTFGLTLLYMILNLGGESLKIVAPASEANQFYTGSINYYGTTPLALLIFWLYISLRFKEPKTRLVFVTVGATVMAALYIGVSCLFRDDLQIQ
jgi:hypothetical protein